MIESASAVDPDTQRASIIEIAISFDLHRTGSHEYYRIKTAIFGSENFDCFLNEPAFLMISADSLRSFLFTVTGFNDFSFFACFCTAFKINKFSHS